MYAPDFEIKYIETVWHDEQTLISLVESIHPLKIELGEALNTFKAYTTIYPKVDEMDKCNLAIHFDIEPELPPHILSPNGEQIPLMKVVNPRTKKVWWTEGSVWLKKYKRWGTQAFRTAGTLTVISGDATFKIYIGLSDDSHKELERYLANFKDDLWELILDDNSYVGGKAKKTHSGGVDESTLKIISNLLAHAKVIANKPKAELREIQNLKERKQVKPVPRTFMELSTKGNAKTLTSRGTEPTYNVVENQYIHYVIASTYKLIRQLVQISSSKGSRYQGNIEQLNARLDALKDHRTINKDLVYKDLHVLQNLCDEHKLTDDLYLQLDRSRSNDFAHKIYIYFIKVTGNVKGSEKTYFVEYKYNETDFWSDKNNDHATKFFDISAVPALDLKIGYEYQVNATVVHNKGVSTKGNRYERFVVHYVDSIRVLSSSEQLNRNRQDLTKYHLEVKTLEASNWIRALNRDELIEQQKERDSILSRICFFETESEKAKSVLKSLEPKIKVFKVIEKSFKKMGVKLSSSFPNSMTFVQNQHYQYMHAGYRKLREQIGLADDDLLLSLEEIDSIGLINMPILYERWCLLQITKVLIQNFHFLCDSTWKRRLIDMVQNHNKNSRLTFKHNLMKRKIHLDYEPLMANGRTPDFMLTVGAKNKDNTTIIKKFVIDAKYHSSEFLASEGGISGVVCEMAHKRNYSENNLNSVFIIHPTLDAIKAATSSGVLLSPQKWAETSYLGELKLFEWENPRFIHQYGALSANPSKSIRYLDEFQRLIGMFLQYSIEESYKCQSHDDVNSNNFCMSCGSTDLVDDMPVSYNGKLNSKKKWYTCNNCSHHTTYNHCWNCQTRLIKNGEYWTYHSLMPMQPTNIKCPSCELPV
ncbi:nuclease domain-containing protein [Shewanella vesiculosa]|uniref:nuclease domain-containing protein n=1 Tax=Shewanella vesiculosa TaxID=518738 RepID=UPI003CFC435F